MRIVAAALFAITSLAPAAQAQTVKDLLDRYRAQWNAPHEPFRIIDNIYYVGTVGLASYLIVTPQGSILIDTVMPESTGLIKANIEKLGFKVADIKIMLNTHAHIDHTGGFAELKKDSGAQMVAGERDKPLLEGGYYPGDEKNADLAFPPLKVDRTVKEGDTVALGGVSLIAHETPGHSPGCTSWETKVKDGNAERSVLIFCSGTVALNKLVGAPTHAGIVDDYRKTYAALKAMNPDVLLAPHPEMYGMQEKRAQAKDGAPNPFVKPGELATYVATLEKDFDTQLAKQQAALKN